MDVKKYNSGIYKIEHTISGKAYIGSATNCNRRWTEHKHRLKTQTHPNLKLQNAWNKYGPEAFIFQVFLKCEPKYLLFYEQRAIVSYEALTEKGYNICAEARSALGVKRSEETKRKMSEAQKGKPKWSGEDKQRISEQMTGTKRGPHSEETKEKIRKAMQGRVTYVQSEETKAKRSLSLKGKPRSEDVKRKISETKQRKKLVA